MKNCSSITLQLVINIALYRCIAGPSGRAVLGVGLRLLTCCGRGFESHRGMDVFLLCVCVLGRGLRDELLTRLEESYRLWRVVVCNQETS
jgi:hypothetical protein